jgi:hypothetical protein
MIAKSNATNATNAARIIGGQNIGWKTFAMRHTACSGTTPTRNLNASSGSDLICIAGGMLPSAAVDSAAMIPAGRNRLSIRNATCSGCTIRPDSALSTAATCCRSRWPSRVAASRYNNRGSWMTCPSARRRMYLGS